MMNAHNALVAAVAARAGVSLAELTRRLRVTTAKVDSYFGRGEHPRVFKGKWFAAILADEVDRIMVSAPYDRNGLARKLPIAIAATLDFSQPWAEYFRRASLNVAAVL